MFQNVFVCFFCPVGLFECLVGVVHCTYVFEYNVLRKTLSNPISTAVVHKFTYQQQQTHTMSSVT